MMSTFRILLKTELKLSLRGMDMVIFALCMPVALVVIIGTVFGGKPAFGHASFTLMDFSFGALSAIAICAGGVMGLPLVISDYRSRKILKRFKVTPASPALLLGVQLVIYAVYAYTSLILLYLTAAIGFGYRLHGSWPLFLGAFTMVMVSMFSIGVLVGGIAKDGKTAGIIASLLYFPMLLFSGATLPYELMPEHLQRAADLLPLTQGIKILKAASLGTPAEQVLVPVIITLILALVCSVISLKRFCWE